MNCCICLRALGQLRWKCLQCNQSADVHCITEWLYRSKTCPLCKYQYLDWDVQQILSHGQRAQDQNNEMNCCICLSVLGQLRWKCLQCNQFADVHCITEWLYRSKTCPLCRYQYLDWDVQQILTDGQRTIDISTPFQDPSWVTEFDFYR
ncbi:uncharacterized protein LOC117125195 [Anneissia japonica]|uniref:uncharacterized protein LOC117125195 n=1 Tax=Anneissia japonica TaxID=1529436 RepID=UPI0014259471|nr:uncharacterized protein LOC117125195 [Anneissia japonica]